MKRIANPYGPLFDNVFNLKLGVRLYRVHTIVYDDIECCALYWPPHLTGNENHKIVVSDKWADTLESYLACVAHEYIHAWQEENGYSYGHGEKTQFKPWARYLNEFYGIEV